MQPDPVSLRLNSDCSLSQRLQSDIWQLIQIAVNWQINCEEPDGMMDSTIRKTPLSHTWEINIASLLFSYEVEAGQHPR
jgi:hypothetical protein